MINLVGIMFMEIMMETIKHNEHVEIIDENNIEMTDVTIIL